MIIPAGGVHHTPAAKYLNVFSANRSFSISSKDEGLDKTTVKAGFSYDLESFAIVTIHNDGLDDLDIDFEMSTLRTIVGSNSNVEIVNAPSIQKIIEPIAVTASATVDNGTMHIIPASSLGELPDVTVNASSQGLLVGANANRKAVTIQVISDERTQLRLGSSTVDTGRGILFAGSLSTPASITIESTGALYAFNSSLTQAKLTVTEVLK